MTPNALPDDLPEVNEVFAEFAAFFSGHLPGDGTIAHEDQLDRTRLDFSLESLHVVDAYLEFLHAHRPEPLGQEWGRAMLWGGAYVGEVIRRHGKQRYDWVDYDDFVKEFPRTIEILGNEKGLGWCALLTFGRSGFTLPINKLLRFLFEGSGESVYLYALHEVAPPEALAQT